MRKTLIIKMAAMVVAVLSLASCAKEGNSQLEAFAFKGSDDANWGMINADGKVIFSDEFKEAPTPATDGRFFVETQEGVYEMFTLDKKPKKVGDEYVSVTSFDNGVALVAEKGKPIEIINTDGKVIKVLDKIDGKVIENAERFYRGYSIVSTADSLLAVVDTKGETVLKPVYSQIIPYADDKFIVKKGDKKMVVDNKGKEVISLSKYEWVQSVATASSIDVSSYIAVNPKKDGDDIWGIIDEKGESVVRPSSKYRGIKAIISDKMFIYTNEDDNYGLMGFDGESLIRAKYDILMCLDENIFAAYSEKDGNYEAKIINKDDEKISENTYQRILPFAGDCAFAKVSDKEWVVIDRNGKEEKDAPDIADMEFHLAEYVQSDYVDLDGIIDALDIKATSLYGIGFTSTPLDALRKKAANESYEVSLDPSGYTYTRDVAFNKTICKANVSMSWMFDAEMSSWNYDYDYNFTYAWNAVNPLFMAFKVDCSDSQMKGKEKDLVEVIVDKFKTLGGSVVKQQDNGTVLNLNNNVYAVCMIMDQGVYTYWGKMNEVIALQWLAGQRSDDGEYAPTEETAPADSAW